MSDIHGGTHVLRGEKRHTVLHDIADDAEFVKVPSPALGAERLLECDLAENESRRITLPSMVREPPSTHLYIVDVIAVPSGTEELVTEPQDQDVLHHLLAQVMVDTEDLFFLPVGLQSLLQIARALEIFAKGLFDLIIGNSKYQLRFSSEKKKQASWELTMMRAIPFFG